MPRFSFSRRKEIYEIKHPETKQGAKGGWHNNKTEELENEIISFSSDTASKLGQAPRTVELSIQRATAFTEEQGEVLKRAEVTQTKATELARKSEEVRTAVVEMLASGKVEDVDEALAVLTPPLSSSWGPVNGKPFTASLPDGKPVAIPEEWKLPSEMRSTPIVSVQPEVSVPQVQQAIITTNDTY